MLEKPLHPTPLTSHLNKPPFDDDAVYPPSEDTFILLDALEADIERLKVATILLEVGSGSGCVSAFLSSLRGPSEALFISTDLSKLACLSTSVTAKANSCTLNPVQCDLISAFRDRLEGAVDVLVFNPPYVPTGEEEMTQAQDQKEIAGAWAGGLDGMKVTDRLLELLPHILSPRGVFYLVAVPENRPLEILTRMKAPPYSLDGQIVLKRRAGREFLHVLRFERKPL